MVSNTDAESELVGLIEFVETGLLTPALHKRLGHFPAGELKMALRDLLDWMSLRGIMRGRTANLGGRVHPLTGRVIARLDALSSYLCAPDECLAFRVEVEQDVQEQLEDFVKERIWHPAWTGRGKMSGRTNHIA